MESTEPADARVRAFFAAPLPEQALAPLEQAVARMRRRAQRSRLRPRFLPPDQLHLTLKFLGSVAASWVPRLAEILRNEAVGLEPIAVSFHEVTAFPRPERARVVVAELSDPAGALKALAERIEDAVEELGIARERRAYRPHVTVARIKRPGDASDFIAAAELEPCAFQIDELRLYQSTLKPQGAEYTPLACEALRGE